MKTTLKILILIIGFTCSSYGQDKHQKPNIVFVVVDTLRADHLKCYGYSRDTAPTLDKYAKEGVLFENMIASSSWTVPSLMSIFTSQPPFLHTVTSSKNKLPQGITTLAAELTKAGYQTFGITSNPLTGRKAGYHTGFEFYDDFTVSLSYNLNLFEDHAAIEENSNKTITSPTISRAVIQWLEKKRDPNKPFFLFMLFFDPHNDYIPKPPFNKMFYPEYKGKITINSQGDIRKYDQYKGEDRKQIIALYDGEIRFTDKYIGKVLSKVRDISEPENTLTVITSDHGEEFWDHGKTHHGYTLYDELIRVPYIMHWPGHLEAGKKIKDQVGHIDIMPTLLELAGVSVPQECKGSSMSDLIKKGTPFPRETTFSETEISDTKLMAIRTNKHKIIYDFNTKEIEAYTLRLDKAEKNNIYSNQPDWVINLTKKLKNFDKKMSESTTKKEEFHQDEKLLKLLKSLGYN